jgi:SAM-dependent methyltransferase
MELDFLWKIVIFFSVSSSIFHSMKRNLSFSEETATTYYAEGNDTLPEWEVDFLEVLLPNVEGLFFLDHAGGNGRVTEHLLTKGAAGAVVLDGSEACLSLAQEKFAGQENVHLCQGDINAPLPFRPGSFDFAVSYFGFPSSQDISKSLASLAETVRLGGKLLVISNLAEFSGEPPEEREALNIRLGSDGRIPSKDFPWSVEDWFSAIESAGLQLEAIKILEGDNKVTVLGELAGKVSFPKAVSFLLKKKEESGS